MRLLQRKTVATVAPNASQIRCNLDITSASWDIIRLSYTLGRQPFCLLSKTAKSQQKKTLVGLGSSPMRSGGVVIRFISLNALIRHARSRATSPYPAGTLAVNLAAAWTSTDAAVPLCIFARWAMEIFVCDFCCFSRRFPLFYVSTIV